MLHKNRLLALLFTLFTAGCIPTPGPGPDIEPPDTVAPLVSSTVPLNAALDVALDSSLAVTFSEALDPSSISASSFILRQAATVIPGVVTYSDVTATFSPNLALTANTVYTAEVTTEVMDLAGNTLESNYVWSFTTGIVADTTVPTVSSTLPLNAATGVVLNSNIAVTFSEAMNPMTVNGSSLTLMQGSNVVPGVVSYAGVTATFNPMSDLAPNTVYTANLSTAATDLAGNALAASTRWNFTTGAAPDTTSPTVLSTVPMNQATGVAFEGNLAVTFSEAMNPMTVSTATFTLMQGMMAVPGVVTYSGVTATFNPATNVSANTL